MARPSPTDFSIEEAKAALGLTPARLQRLIDEGKIGVKRDGQQVWIPRQSILDYMSTVTKVGKRRR